MADDMKITGPVNVRSQADSVARVALELTRAIVNNEKSTERSNRSYWLDLYSQCYAVASGEKPSSTSSSSGSSRTSSSSKYSSYSKRR